MKEKIAWAEANGVNAPAHSRAIAHAEAEIAKDDCCAKKPCCPPKAPESKPENSFVWINAIEAQSCHGKPANAMGVMTMAPAVVSKYIVLRADVSPAFDWLTPFDVPVPSRTSDISTPPPKLG